MIVFISSDNRIICVGSTRPNSRIINGILRFTQIVTIKRPARSTTLAVECCPEGKSDERTEIQRFPKSNVKSCAGINSFPDL